MKFKVACIQTSSGENQDKNILHLEKLFSKAFKRKPNLICLPECVSLLTDSNKIIKKYDRSACKKFLEYDPLRCYYFKVARSSTLSFLNEKYLKATASNYFLPLQIEIAISKGLIPFYSIAKLSRRPAMQRMVNIWNSKNALKFEILPGLYYTCNDKVEDNDKEMCWQNIAILKINDYKDFNLPRR